MTSSFTSFFELVRSDTRQQLVWQFEASSSAEVIAALLRAELLAHGPPATHYPCIEAGTGCPRHVVPYRGPRPDLYCARAVPPDRDFCCSAENLTATQVCTYVASEARLAEFVVQWAGAQSAIDGEAEATDSLYRIGYCQRDGERTRVFLARRLATRAARARLRELETLGPCLVVALMREGISAELEERYGGRSTVSLVFLEDIMALSGDAVTFRTRGDARLVSDSLEVARTGRTFRVVSHLGERTVSEQEAERLRTSDDLHLFVDLTINARAGGAAGYALIAKDGGQPKRESIVLRTIHTNILLEYVLAAGKPIAPQRLECVRAAGVLDGLRRVRELRKEIDEGYGRDQYRAFQSHKDRTGKVSEFSFAPPSDFRMAILLPGT